VANFIRTLNKIEEGIAGFALLALSFLTFGEAILRYTVSVTFAWFQEVANYSIIFFTYLGASIGVKYGTHFSMEALTEYAPDRISHLLKAVGYFLSGIVGLLFIYFGVKHMAQVREFGVKSPAMQLSMYIPYIPIALFSITMAFRFFVLSGRHFRSFLRREPFERVRKKG
jgi:C4-dicarboxylate transporter DctQ subunit